MVCASWPGSVLFQSVTKFGVSSSLCVWVSEVLSVWGYYLVWEIQPNVRTVKNSEHLTMAEAAVGDFGGITEFQKQDPWAKGDVWAAGELPWEQGVSLFPPGPSMGCCRAGCCTDSVGGSSMGCRRGSAPPWISQALGHSCLPQVYPGLPWSPSCPSSCTDPGLCWVVSLT